jgi:hypothetical protein
VRPPRLRLRISSRPGPNPQKTTTNPPAPNPKASATTSPAGGAAIYCRSEMFGRKSVGVANYATPPGGLGILSGAGASFSGVQEGWSVYAIDSQFFIARGPSPKPNPSKEPKPTVSELDRRLVRSPAPAPPTPDTPRRRQGPAPETARRGPPTAIRWPPRGRSYASHSPDHA